MLANTVGRGGGALYPIPSDAPVSGDGAKQHLTPFPRGDVLSCMGVLCAGFLKPRVCMVNCCDHDMSNSVSGQCRAASDDISA